MLCQSGLRLGECEDARHQGEAHGCCSVPGKAPGHRGLTLLQAHGNIRLEQERIAWHYAIDHIVGGPQEFKTQPRGKIIHRWAMSEPACSIVKQASQGWEVHPAKWSI